MSAKKITTHPPLEQHLTVSSRSTDLTLSPEAVSIHKGGIEFRSPSSFPAWTEMTVTIKSPQDGGAVNCTGVVVGCTGNKHSGYHVSMVFTSMSKQSESRLNSIVYSRAT